MTDYRRVGQVDPRSLADARLQLHHAVVLASAVGRSLAPKQPGFRHAALTWNEALAGLSGAPVEAGKGHLQASLGFAPPTLHLADDAADRGRDRRSGSAALPLDGVAVEGAEAWLRERLTSAGLPAERLAVRWPADLPPLDPPRRLAPDATTSAELGQWFGLADALLSDLSAVHGAGGPVPCWPDHFDLSVVIRLQGAALPPDAQVALGFSPGDATIREPYLYVTPWPLSPSRVGGIPAPAGGHWQVEGWVGLAQTATSLLAAADPRTAGATFLERGFEIGRDLLHAG